MRSVLRPLAATALTFACFAASCSADPSAQDAAPETTASQAAEASTAVESAESKSEETPQPASASDFEVLSAVPAERSIPSGAVEERVMVAVGSSVSDPRHIELTLFTFDDPTAAAQATAFVGDAASAEAVDLASGPSFVFLPTMQNTGGVNRRDLQLLNHGPESDSVVRGNLGQAGLVVDAARVLQPADVDLLVTAFRDRSSDESEPLPVAGMAVLIDEALGDGIIVELQSADGPIQVEMYDDTVSAWFDYAARSALAIGIEPPELGLGSLVALQPSTSFGVNGTPLDPNQLFWWDRGRLTTITYPPSIADESIAELASTTRQWDLDDLLEPSPQSVADDPYDASSSEMAASPSGATTQSDVPSATTMAQLQNFVETFREVEASQRVDFDFVESLPFEDFEGFFVSSRLWMVADALDLVEDGQDQTSADLARVERVRGLPGIVILQPTEAETNMIVVHEMAHIVDTRSSFGSPRSRELVEPTQALLEGNAHRVAYAYVESLAPEQRQQIPTFPGIFPDGDPRLSPAMQDIIEFPYDEGRLFATAVADAGGESAIESAFLRPPTSSEHILFPDSYFDDDQPVAVEAPEPPAGAEVVDTGVLGAYLLALAAREATGQDLQIISGWAGDSYVTYRSERQICLTASVRMDTAAAAEDLAAGFRGGDRRVDVTGDMIDLTSCPGDLTE